MHVPATSWHPHHDQTIEVKRPTEWEAWAHMMRATLMELVHGNTRLMVGYWADAMNVLPPEVRKALIQTIALGFGLQIAPAKDDPNSIEITLIQRYEPVVGEKKTESGLVVPKGPGEATQLVLPGQQEFNVRSRR
jgi:hypothetical protein